MRLDLDGPPHRNPDDEEIPWPHLHVYREGYGDKWASPARLKNIRTAQTSFQRLKRSCGIATSRSHRSFRRGCSHDDDS
jgi:hypothetical protein